MGSQHKDLTLDENHALIARTYANIAARDADTSFHVTANLNKVVRVDSPLSFYVLTAITPTWSEFTSTGNDQWTELTDTPGSISANLNVQGNSGGTALEFGQDLRTAGAPTFNNQILSGQASNVSLSLNATDGALRLNRMTVTQRDAMTPLFGMMVFNTTDNDAEVYNGTTWITMMATGDVLKVGTPANNQVGVWTGDGTIEGDVGLTFDTSPLVNQLRLGSSVVGETGGLLIDGHENPSIELYEHGVSPGDTAQRWLMRADTAVLKYATQPAAGGAGTDYMTVTRSGAVAATVNFIVPLVTMSGALTVGGAGVVTKVDTPLNNQLGVWTGDGTLEGTIGLTFDGNELQSASTVGGTPVVARLEHTLTVNADVTQGLHLIKNLNGSDFGFKIEGSGLNDAVAGLRFIGSFGGSGDLTLMTLIRGSGNFGIGIDAPTAKLHVFGTAKIAGALDMTSQLINNVLDPVSAQDAATRNYVDTQSHGDVFKVGTPVNNQVGVWTGDGTIEGDAQLLFDTSVNTLTIGAGGVGNPGGNLIVDGFFVPTFEMKEGDAGADGKRWRRFIDSGLLTDCLLTDAGGTGDTYMEVLRAGSVVTRVSFPSGKIGVGFATTPTALFEVRPVAAEIGQIIHGAVSQTADLLQIRDNAAVVLARFDDEGNLGVGATPLAKLHAIPAAAQIGMIVQGGASQTADLFQARDEVGTVIFDIDDIGLVGISVVSPAARLHVDAAASGAVVGMIVQGQAAQTADLFQAQNSASTVLVAITSAGNMGVGQAVPNSRLHVEGSFSVERMAVGASAPTADEMIIGVTSTASPVTITIQTSDIVMGRLFIIKDESGAASVNNITIATEGSETIDGQATVAITQNYGVIRLYATGSNLFSW